jgi:hypothetical protein
MAISCPPPSDQSSWQARRCGRDPPSEDRRRRARDRKRAPRGGRPRRRLGQRPILSRRKRSSYGGIRSAPPNVYSPWRCSPTRQPANAESEAFQSSQIRPARHPPREAPKTAQKCDLKVWRPTVASHRRAGPGALPVRYPGGDQERSRERLEAEPEQTRVLAEAPKLLSQDCRHLAGARQLHV